MRYRKSQILAPTGEPLMIMEVPTSHYAGASSGRRLAGWHAPSTGPNSALNYALPNLRNRARAGHRNMPLVRAGIEKNVTNEIGTGITPRSLVEDDALRKTINALWETSSAQFDPEGVLDVYGQQAQIARARRLSGECFVRVRYRRPQSALAVPIQFQVLESDFVPLELNLTRPNGHQIIAGIEFNRSGQRVAYWMHKQHPGESYSTASLADLIRVPAAQVAHHYLPLHPGQIRGEPDPSAAMLKAYTFDSYDDAELTRKQTRAPYTGAIYREQYSQEDYRFDPFTGDPIETDAPIPESRIEPGTMLQFFPGERLDLFKGDDTGEGYSDFMRWQSMLQATAQNLPYELLTGDWSKVNDRLVRAILNEYRRRIQMDQWHLMIPQVCRWMWGHWLNRALLCGVIKSPGYGQNIAATMKHGWCPHGWPYISPEGDVNAKIKAIDNDLLAHEDVVAEQGDDLDDIQRRNRTARTGRSVQGNKND